MKKNNLKVQRLLDEIFAFRNARKEQRALYREARVQGNLKAANRYRKNARTSKKAIQQAEAQLKRERNK